MKKYISIFVMIFVANLYGANLTETNNVIFKGTVLCSNGLSTGSSILPTTSNSHDIGSSAMPFRHGYFGTNSLYLGQNKLGVSSNGSLTYNDNTVPTNISVNGNLGVINGGVAYANVDIPNYDPVNDQIFLDKVSGREVSLDYATATLASGVTDTWHAISVSSNGLVVAAWTRSIATGNGYVYISTNGPNSLVKNNVLGERVATDLKVTADGRMIIAAYWGGGGGVSISTNYGANWTVVLGSYGGAVDASDDGSVILMTSYNSTYMSTNSGSAWTEVFNSYWWYSFGNGAPGHVAVSGDGNVLMFSSFGTPTGPLRYDISTNRGVSFVNTVNGGAPGTIGWGSQYACATRTGNRIYMTCSGNSDNGEGYVYYLETPNYNTFNNITPTAMQFYRGIDCSPDGSGIIALTECSGASGNGTSKTGTVYVSTNYGATFSSPTNFYDVGTVTTYPRWLGKCAWQDNINGGLALRGGSGDGKIYRVEIGSVVTNTLNILGDAKIYGSLAVENLTALYSFIPTNFIYWQDSSNWIAFSADITNYYFSRSSNGIVNIKTNSMMP